MAFTTQELDVYRGWLRSHMPGGCTISEEGAAFINLSEAEQHAALVAFAIEQAPGASDVATRTGEVAADAAKIAASYGAVAEPLP